MSEEHRTRARFPSMSPPPTHSAWEDGYEVGYREGGDSATEDWKLVWEDRGELLREAAEYLEEECVGLDTAAELREWADAVSSRLPEPGEPT